MSPQRVIRPAARRSPSGARSLVWTASAAALPVIVVVLVLVAVTLGALLFTARGFDSLAAVVAVEWLVINRVPLIVDDLVLGFLPLLPALGYVAVLARQTRMVLADVEEPGPREAGAAITGVTLAGVLLTVLAMLVVGQVDSDFPVRHVSPALALVWTAAVAVAGSALGVWLYFRRELREALPLWVRGGLHLGVAFTVATWAIATLLVLIGLVVAWEPVANLLGIGKDFVGTAALAGISVAYLPNVVGAAATVVVGGEAHLGEASFSVFAVSRGPLPEVPLAAMLPTTNPPWVVQGLLLVTALVAAALARSVAHWFRTTADAVRATCLGAALVAGAVALTPVVAGGQLGALGMVGTGSLIASLTALLVFGVIGSATIALSLAGLTRRRERAESELQRRRRRAGTLAPEPEPEPEPDTEAETEPVAGVNDDTDDDTDDDDEVSSPGEQPVDPDAESAPATEADAESGAGPGVGPEAESADQSEEKVVRIDQAGSAGAAASGGADDEGGDESEGEDPEELDDPGEPANAVEPDDPGVPEDPGEADDGVESENTVESDTQVESDDRADPDESDDQGEQGEPTRSS